MTNKNVLAALAAKATVQDAIASFNTSISEKKLQLDSIDAEIQRLYDLPLCFDDFSIYLRAWIDKMGKSHLGTNQCRIIDADPRRGYVANKMAWSSLIAGRTPITGYAHPGYWDHTKDIFSAFCCFFPEQVYSRLLEVYREANMNHWGNEEFPRVAEREESIKTMHTQRDTLQQEIKDLQEQVNALSA